MHQREFLPGADLVTGASSGLGAQFVNAASILGLRQAGGVVSYAVSKAGVIQLTEALALEWARHGIRDGSHLVNTL